MQEFHWFSNHALEMQSLQFGAISAFTLLARLFHPLSLFWPESNHAINNQIHVFQRRVSKRREICDGITIFQCQFLQGA
jgi:hypothetical protein